MPAENDKDGAVEDAGTTNVGMANVDEDGEPRLQRPGRARMPVARARMAAAVPEGDSVCDGRTGSWTWLGVDA